MDGKEIWNMCSFKYMVTEYENIGKNVEQTKLPAWEAQKTVRRELMEDGVFAQWDFYAALEGYCNEPITTLLTSRNVLIQSLAMLDKRLGKRQFGKIDVSGEHEMIQYFYALRCESPISNLGSKCKKGDKVQHN